MVLSLEFFLRISLVAVFWLFCMILYLIMVILLALSLHNLSVI